MASVEEPPYLSVGTDVSAKYKGAFCEAKITDVNKHVKLRVMFDGDSGTFLIDDTDLKTGSTLETGTRIEAKHPEKKQQTYVQATITKILDHSRYTVVFDDGDQCVLRRNSLCLKSGKHFAESETLDQLPLTNPEHFGNPVKVGAIEQLSNTSKVQLNHLLLNDKPKGKSSPSIATNSSTTSEETKSITNNRKRQQPADFNDDNVKKMKKEPIANNNNATASSTSKRAATKGRKRRESVVNGSKQAVESDDVSLDSSQDSGDATPVESNVKFESIEVGVKLMVQYGKGKVQNVYEAKVNKIETSSAGKVKYFVHYTGWNNRYDEWITRNRILSIVTEKENGSKDARSKQSEIAQPNSVRKTRKPKTTAAEPDVQEPVNSEETASVEAAPSSAELDLDQQEESGGDLTASKRVRKVRKTRKPVTSRTSLDIQEPDDGEEQAPTEPAPTRAEQEVDQPEEFEVDLATGKRVRKVRKTRKPKTSNAGLEPQEPIDGEERAPAETALVSVELDLDQPDEFEVDSVTGKRVRKVRKTRKPKTSTPGLDFQEQNDSEEKPPPEPAPTSAELDTDQPEEFEVDSATGKRVRKVRKTRKPATSRVILDLQEPIDGEEKAPAETVLTSVELEVDPPEECEVDSATGKRGRKVRKTRKPKTSNVGLEPQEPIDGEGRAPVEAAPVGLEPDLDQPDEFEVDSVTGKRVRKVRKARKPVISRTIPEPQEQIEAEEKAPTDAAPPSADLHRNSAPKSPTHPVTHVQCDEIVAPEDVKPKQDLDEKPSLIEALARQSDTLASPRSRPIYKFCDNIDESDCDKKISILQERMMALRQTYNSLKTELNDLDRHVKLGCATQGKQKGEGYFMAQDRMLQKPCASSRSPT